MRRAEQAVSSKRMPGKVLQVERPDRDGSIEARHRGWISPEGEIRYVVPVESSPLLLPMPWLLAMPGREMFAD